MFRLHFFSFRVESTALNLCLAEGDRTELAINIRTDDGLTNGAGNVIKLVQLHQQNKPSDIVWVQFDQFDVGQKTRNENRTSLCPLGLSIHGHL